MPTYTEEEVQALLKAQEERLEAAHFEEQTKVVLTEINKRLNEANGYKSTIGKNVLEIKARLESLEEARLEDVRKAKEELDNKATAQAEKHLWYQDWWVRALGAGAITVQVIQTLHIFRII